MQGAAVNFEYELKNFKAFPTSNAIALRPITLVYGPNSSGKSSVLQSLLLLKQTLDESETPETLLLPKGNLVDLGGFREFVHRHELDRSFSVRLNLDIDPHSTQMRMLGELASTLDIRSLGLRIDFGYDQSAANAIIQEFAFYINDKTAPFCTFTLKAISQAEVEQLGPRMPLRGGRPALMYRGDKINQQHPFLLKLAEVEQQQLRSRLPPDEIGDRLKLFKRRLQHIAEAEASAKGGDAPKPRRGKKSDPTNQFPEKTGVPGSNCAA